MRAAEFIVEYATITPQLKSWMRNSILVDKNGNPLVLYHGTDKDFNSFNTNIFWAAFDSELANVYSYNHMDSDSVIYPVFMRVERPFDGDQLPHQVSIGTYFTEVKRQADINGHSYNISEISTLVSKLKSLEKFPNYKIENYEMWNAPADYYGTDGAELVFLLMKKLGFDSIKFTENDTLTYGVFDKNAVKSAVGNKGDYSDSDDMIAEEDVDEATAYHGTPHRDIKKFDTSKIGSGEGAQAYGWGLYFASKREIAEWYRKTLSKKETTVQINGKGFNDTPWLRNSGVEEGWFNIWVAHPIATGVGLEGVIGSIENVIERSERQGNTKKAQAAQKILDMFNKGKITANIQNGQLYEVDIPEDNEMLFWDRPLDQQPPHVEKAINEMLSNISSEKLKYFYDADSSNYTGKNFYTNLKQSFFNLANNDAAKAASQTLLKMDIRGIKYLDGVSRTSGEGSYNYVIFSGDDVSIKNQFYEDSIGEATAYHGTPHRDIKKFDTSRIGSGEGAQAYGWGLYFADKKDVAEWYRNNLSGSDSDAAYSYKGKTYSRGQPEWKALSLIVHDGLRGAKSVLKQYITDFKNKKPYALEYGQDFINKLSDIIYNHTRSDKIVPVRGQTYQVKIPSADLMLLWDKSITSQSVQVKQILVKNGVVKSFKDNLADFSSPSESRGKGLGSNVYHYLVFKKGSDKSASEYLKSLGIIGIKYLDGDSRTGNKGSYNYVIFSGDDVEIEHQFYEDSLEEGWKQNLAAIGAAGAMAFGGSGDTMKTPKIAPKPAATAPAKQQQSTPLTPEEHLKQTALKHGIKGVELAQFLAQCAHETMNFARMTEMGSNGYLTKKYDIKHNPSKAKALGNTEIGDGVKYKGRGFIQLTGKENYIRAGKALGLPLEDQPQLLEQPDVAAKVSVWYWKTRVQPKVSDFNDVKASTKPINGGLKGLPDRVKHFFKYKKELGIEK